MTQVQLQTWRDVVVYEGRRHRITDVARRAGWAWPVATDVPVGRWPSTID
jgi:hypothetical protein